MSPIPKEGMPNSPQNRRHSNKTEKNRSLHNNTNHKHKQNHNTSNGNMISKICSTSSQCSRRPFETVLEYGPGNPADWQNGLALRV